jgi:hypothetical protein
MKASKIRSLWKKASDRFHAFAKDRPGSRFRRVHQQLADPARSRFVGAALIAGSIILIVAGILLGLIPGVPGFILVLAGLACLGISSRPVAAWLDRWEVKGRRLLANLPIVGRWVSDR